MSGYIANDKCGKYLIFLGLYKLQYSTLFHLYTIFEIIKIIINTFQIGCYVASLRFMFSEKCSIYKVTIASDIYIYCIFETNTLQNLSEHF